MEMSNRKRVVIIGGGFGGLACARGLKKAPVDVCLIDRRNFHLFQPLLYQVATGGLSPANIAAPLRSILRKQRNAMVLLHDVSDFEPKQQRVHIKSGEPIHYDYLVIAAGSSHHYFGKDEEWASMAPGLKTIEDATEIRRRVLSAFELAERTPDLELRKKLLTFVIIGGGPTGLELAGALCELSRQTMRSDFRAIDPSKARIILIENSPTILNNFHISLAEKAKQAVQSLGAEVWNDTRLTELYSDHAMVSRNGQLERIDTSTVLWAAGVKASPLGALIADRFEGTTLDRGGRVTITPSCSLEKFPNVFVIGDMSSMLGSEGKPLPGVAPVAMQQGNYVAKCIAAALQGNSTRSPFQYVDKGNMATIGRSRAVMESGRIRMSGKIAWLAWLFIHILYLAKFENRLLVMLQWSVNYITRNRSARLITHPNSSPPIVKKDETH